MLLELDSSRNSSSLRSRATRFLSPGASSHGHVKVAGGFEELFAGVEGLAAVACHGKPGKEQAGALAKLLGGGGEVLGALFAAQQCIGIARQLFKADVADRESEVVRRNLFQFMRLVEDDRGSLGKDAGVGRAGGLLFDGEVGEEQVVVDDDDVRLESLAAHLGDEAAVVIRAGAAQTGFGAGIEFLPEGAGLGHAR